MALDSQASKYLLHPNSRLPIHDPDNAASPLYQYLAKCAESGGGLFDVRRVEVSSWDFREGKFQRDQELSIVGPRHWGRGAKAILKYLYLRYSSG